MSKKQPEIYAMNLHERLFVGSEIQVHRVPGGWIYELYSDVDGEPTAATFVPFHNEFMAVESDGPQF